MKSSRISIENIISRNNRIAIKNSNLQGNKIFINGKIINNLGTVSSEPIFINRGEIVNKDLFIRNITDENDLEIIDLEENYLTPSIIDQHIHGSSGIDFNNSNEVEIRSLLRKLKELGHFGILATFVPDTIEKLNSQMALLRRIIKSQNNDEAKILGINLEGPFFSKKRAGIHAPELILEPTLENFNKFDLASVKMMTIAPENDKDYKAITHLNNIGIIPSAGHSDATAEEVRNSGVKCITHLFNAMSPFHHRNLSITNEGLSNDDLYVEVNTALELLAPDTINLIQKAKPDDKIILISDSLRGLKEGEKSFTLGTKEIYVDENGVAKDDIGTLAGSLLLLGEVAKIIVDKTNINFEKFIKYTTINPAKLLGLEEDFYITEGKKPNLTIWDKDSLKPIKTLFKGE